MGHGFDRSFLPTDATRVEQGLTETEAEVLNVLPADEENLLRGYTPAQATESETRDAIASLTERGLARRVGIIVEPTDEGRRLRDLWP